MGNGPSGLCAKLGSSSLFQRAQLSFADMDVGEGREQDALSFADMDVGEGREQDALSFADMDVGERREQDTVSVEKLEIAPLSAFSA